MPATLNCRKLADQMDAYVSGGLGDFETATIDAHLKSCAACREEVKRIKAVQGLLVSTIGRGTLSDDFPQQTGKRIKAAAPAAVRAERIQIEEDEELELAGAPAGSSALSRLGAAPWWLVSLSLHVLVIALASLVSMSFEAPRSDDSVIMVTELQPRTQVDQKQEEPKKELQDALSSKHDTPPTDPNSKEASDVVVPPDILAKAELGDHFETINPDLPDTHSALGNPDSRSFHSVEGNTEAAGGGGMGGEGMDDLIGVGGAASKGTGGGWGGGDGTGVGIGSGPGKGSFGQRGGGGRKLMVKRHGGSKATENAVDKALEWLAYHQEADGHWDTKKYGAAEFKPDTAMTSLALLAFLGAGHTEKVGGYKDNVKRAVEWLISKQQPNGLVLDKTDIARGAGYSAAMATMALAEAAGMGNVKTTREAAQKAVDYCTEAHENGDGSEKQAWRYDAKSKTEDISVSGWFIMALKSAKVAGLHVNPASFEGAMKFLDQREKKDPAGAAGIDTGYGPPKEYGYLDNNSVAPRRSAIGLLGRQFMGVKKEELESSVELFVKKGGVPTDKKEDLYFWYYGTLCVFQQGGDVWKRWNEGMKGVLLPSQCVNGDDAGSWTPVGAYSTAWGRVGQTAISALCLEVYYRYLQLQPDHQ